MCNHHHIRIFLSSWRHLVPINSHPHILPSLFPLPPALSSHWFILSVLIFLFWTFWYKMVSCHTWSSVTGIFHWAQCFPGPPYGDMDQHCIPFYGWVINTMLWGYATFYLSIYHLVHIWVVSAFCLSWITLPWTFLYKILWGRIFSFSVGIYLGVDCWIMW